MDDLPLSCTGRWVFVSYLDDDTWVGLTARALDAAGGQIENMISVADRAAAVPPNSASREILLRLVDTGEPWERHHAAGRSLEVLRASIGQPVESFWRLCTRLIKLGYHEAKDINRDDLD